MHCDASNRLSFEMSTIEVICYCSVTIKSWRKKNTYMRFSSDNITSEFENDCENEVNQ